MSFSKKDRSFRASAGNRFPLDPAADTEATLAAVVADALRKDFGDTPARVEYVARLTGMNPRTVKNWLQARNGPNGAGLVVLMRHSDAVASAVLMMAERHDVRKRLECESTMRELRRLAAALVDQLDRS